MASQVLQTTFTVTLTGGETTVVTHGLRLQNRTIAPNSILPDQATLIGVTVYDDTTITFYNPSGGALTAIFTARVDHTYQRAINNTSATIWRGGTGSSPSSAYVEISGMGANAQPTNQTVIFYVMGNVDASTGLPGPTWGSDTNPGTKALPLLTIPAVWERIARAGVQGVQVIVYLGGYTAPVPDPINGPEDPWDGYCQAARVSYTRELRLNGTGAFRNTYCYRGPRKMFTLSPALTFVGAAQVGVSRVRLTFVQNVFPSSARGTFLTLRRTDDDREIFFPHTIVETGGNWAEVVGLFSAVDWALYAPLGYFAQTAPAVQIAGDPDYESNGVLVHGDGAGKIGDGRSGGAGDDTNPTHTLERLMIIRGCYTWTGQLSADTVWFDNTTRFTGPGELRLHGCTSGPNGSITITSAGRVLGADSFYLPNLERTGRALVPTPALNADPMVQTIAPIDLVCTGADTGGLVIGENTGTKGGTYRAIHGLAVSYPGVPVSLWGPDSCLFIHDFAPLYVRTTSVTGEAIWAKDGARVRTYVGPGTFMELITGGGNPLRVGVGVAITVADFLNAVLWNRNFTRRNEVSGGGYPLDDTSRIWDQAWEPAGYTP